MRRTSFGFVATSFARTVLVCLPLALGCTELLPIEEGRCGNEVVENGYGEDCEPGVAGNVEGLICYGTESPHRCRYDCRPTTTDGGEPEPGECPEGWKCGADGVCREPTPAFVRAGGPAATETPDQLIIADVDGDRRQDIVAAASKSISVHYVDQGGILGSTRRIPTDRVFTASGDLDGDLAADIAVPSGRGLGVLRGQANRALDPATFPTLSDGGEAAIYLRAIDIDPTEDHVGPEICGIARFPDGYVLARVDETMPVDAWTKEPLGEDVWGFDHAWAGPFNRPCEKVAARYWSLDQNVVKVFAPCDQASQPAFDEITQVTLPGPPLEKLSLLKDGNVSTKATVLEQQMSGGIFFVHVNGDAYPDLVAPVRLPDAFCGGNGCGGVAIAYGLYDGTYTSTPPQDPLQSLGDNIAELVYLDIGVLAPLAFAHLDDDGVLDMIDPGGLAFGTLPPPGSPSTYRTVDRRGYKADGFKSAIVADFNVDGLPDIAASSGYGIGFLNNLGGGLFSPSEIGTAGAVNDLVAADVDADGLDDLVFGEKVSDPQNPAVDRIALSIAYGRPTGAPEAPVTVARFPSITQILPLNLIGLTGDLASDLVVLYPKDRFAPKNGWSTSAVLGSSIRQIQSSIFFKEEEQELQKAQYPLLPLIGRFGDDGSLDIATLTVDPESLVANLWWVPMPDPPKKLTRVPVPLNLDPSWLSVTTGAVVDLDRDGTDEIVLAFHASGPDLATPHIMIFRPGEDPVEVTDSSVPNRLYASLRAADFDGDNFTDILAMQIERTGMPGEAGRFVTTPVFLKNEGGTLAAPKEIISLEEATPCPTGVPDLGIVVATALEAIDADADARKELVLVGPTGTYLYHRKMVDDGAGKLVEKPVVECILEGSPGVAVAAGELTGDGVDDLAIGADGSIYILAGVPKRP